MAQIVVEKPKKMIKTLKQFLDEIDSWEYPDCDEQGKIGYAMAIDDVKTLIADWGGCFKGEDFDG